jgi:hypothetical protein
MSVSEEFRGVVDQRVESIESAPAINGFLLEPRCRICRNDDVRTTVNDLLATGASYAMVLRALGDDNATLQQRVLADGARIQPDAVIAATGYRGCPRFQRHSPGEGGQDHPSAAGLFFRGYRVDFIGQLRLMRIDAAIAKAVRRQRAA